MMVVEEAPGSLMEVPTWYLWKPGGKVSIKELIDTLPPDFSSIGAVKMGSNTHLAGHYLTDQGEKRFFRMQLDQDSDGDGLPDDYEKRWDFGVNDSTDGYGDPDGDGIPNRAEFLLGTRPTPDDDGIESIPTTDSTAVVDGVDIDGDGMPDTWEAFYGLDRLDAEDRNLDYDRDGYTNAQEFSLGTTPVGPPSYHLHRIHEYYGYDEHLTLVATNRSGDNAGPPSPGDVLLKDESVSPAQYFVKPRGSADLVRMNAADLDATPGYRQNVLDIGEGAHAFMADQNTASGTPGWRLSFPKITDGVVDGSVPGFFASQPNHFARHPDLTNSWAVVIQRVGHTSNEVAVVMPEVARYLPMPAGASASPSGLYFIDGTTLAGNIRLSNSTTRGIVWDLAPQTPTFTLLAPREESVRSYLATATDAGSGKYLLGTSLTPRSQGRQNRPIIQSLAATTSADIPHLGGGEMNIADAFGDWFVGSGVIDATLPDYDGYRAYRGMISADGSTITQSLDVPSDRALQFSAATDINHLGEIIGDAKFFDSDYRSAVLWRHSASYLIDDHIIGGTAAAITRPLSIDDDGCITAEAFIGGAKADVILVPRTDADGDAMPDTWEIAQGLDPFNANDAQHDLDSDGLKNALEFKLGSDPSVADTDGDKLPDGWEHEWGFDLRDPSNATTDPDEDGMNNLAEWRAGTIPTGLWALHTIELPGTSPHTQQQVLATNAGPHLAISAIDQQGATNYFAVTELDETTAPYTTFARPIPALNGPNSQLAEVDIKGITDDGTIVGKALRAFDAQPAIFTLTSGYTTADLTVRTVGELASGVGVTDFEITSISESARNVLLDINGVAYVFDVDASATRSVSQPAMAIQGWFPLQNRATMISDDGNVYFTQHVLPTGAAVVEVSPTGAERNLDIVTSEMHFPTHEFMVGTGNNNSFLQTLPDASSNDPNGPLAPIKRIDGSTGEGAPILSPLPHPAKITDRSTVGQAILRSADEIFLRKQETTTRISSLRIYDSFFDISFDPLASLSPPEARRMQCLITADGSVAISDMSPDGAGLYILTEANDRDNDSLPDDWEVNNGFLVTVNTGEAHTDDDNDGMTYADEIRFGSNPNAADSDGDGVDDSTEAEQRTDPLDPDTFITSYSFQKQLKRVYRYAVVGAYRESDALWDNGSLSYWDTQTHPLPLMENEDWEAYKPRLFDKLKEQYYALHPKELVGLPSFDRRSWLPSVNLSDMIETNIDRGKASTMQYRLRFACNQTVDFSRRFQYLLAVDFTHWHERERKIVQTKIFPVTLGISPGEQIGKIISKLDEKSWIKNYGDDLLIKIPKDDFAYVEHQLINSSLLPVGLSVDANRDGEIEFEIDQTSTDAPYRFWFNNDDDSKEEDDEEYGDDSQPDHVDNVIPTQRDLEDFSRIRLMVGGLHDDLKKGDVTVTIKFKEGTVEGSPALNLFLHLDEDGDRDYLLDEQVAARHLDLRNLGRVTASAGYTFDPAFWSGDGLPGYSAISTIKPYRNLLFEGASKGKGELVLEFKRGNDLLGEVGSCWINLLDVRNMYQRVKITPDDPDQFVEPSDVTGNASSTAIPPLPAIGWVWDPWGKDFVEDPEEEKNYIVFVHGWNMNYTDSQKYAETMFKRLWQMGFKGRYAFVRWPTYKGVFTYNSSDYRAWLCGKGLASFVNSFPSEYSRAIVAHSMGNIVVGSALREGMQARNYALLNAAVPAMCYDERKALYRFERETPDGDDDPITRSLGFTGKLSRLNQTSLTNFFLKDDVALTGIANLPGIGEANRWEFNNRFYKPETFGGGLVGYDYDPKASPGERVTLEFFVNFGRHLRLYAEAAAFATASRTKAVGAEHRARGAIKKAIDMDRRYGFDDVHSAQFIWRMQKTQDFYYDLLDDFNLNPIKE